MGSGATAMSTGWDNIAKTSKVFLGLGDRMDNTLTYQSPKFAGIGSRPASLRSPTSMTRASPLKLRKAPPTPTATTPSA